MKTWFYLCLFLLLGLTAGAQQPTTAPGKGHALTGKLLDAGSGAAVPYATINVLDAAAQLVTGGISDEAGGFRLDGIPAGPLTVEFRFMGYQTLSQPLAAGSRLDLGPIKLQPVTTQLGEVTVTGEKPTVSLQLDKKVFEVGKDILSQGGSGHDVLNGVPSVAVSPGGGISLRGNANVTVLINGRRSGLTQSNGLDQIPASQIERVEVITNPSARYDAAGSAGIINVILKKNKQPGLGGQVRLVGGLPNDTRLTPSLTFKSAKVNLFATAGLRWSDYRGRYRTDQATGLADGRPASLQQRQRENRHDDGRVLYVGADYFINDHNTITAAFLKNDTKDHDKTWLDYAYLNGAGQTDSTLQRQGESWESRSYNQLELNYTRLFAQAGRKYTVDVQYDFWNSDKSWQLATNRLYPQAQALPGIRTGSVGASKDLLMQTDLVQPLGKQSTVEFGLKAEGRQVTSNFGAEQEQGAEWAVFRGIDNQLRYDELISSGYAQWGSKVKKLSYLLGLRAELTRITIRDEEGRYNNEKNYHRLFPTLNLGYQLGEGLTTQLNYSRRINRPTIWMLYPFNELTDLNAQYVGNPDLNPSYADVLELGLLRNWTTLTLNPSVYYQQTSGFIQTYTYRDATGTFISTPINLSRETRRGLELSVLYNPLKWLSFNTELNLYTFTQQGRYREQDFAFSSQTLTGRLSTQLKLPLKLGVQARYNVNGAQRNAQTRTSAIHFVNVAVSKNLLRDKATLVLDGSNVFDSNQTRTQTTGPDYVFNQVSSPNAARYRLSFTYRFNLQDGQAIRQARSSNRN
ncbi:outer membrane beta-barrel family protein [Hymenobacter lucidus]|uniref:TonB-dependent receptor n=1 Tax=Hymenobacter lucidus TaxID=2880930 RepID=A0ABS8AWK9_9BACT|nr:outer membrane beta-barrel family protein [Hymenobacter lucidus]MCB2410182.1 TonB-dependent receptor [Hymenobacter lucidus]